MKLRQHNSIVPPVLAQRLLRSFLRADLVEEVEGDLLEKFFVEIESGSQLKAKLNYWAQVFKYIRPFAIRKRKSSLNHYDMFENYMRTGVRSMLKNKAFTFINVFGLAIGIACCVLLALFIQDELSFEKHFADHNRIYRITTTLNSDNGTETRLQRASPIIGPTMLREFPEPHPRSVSPQT